MKNIIQHNSDFLFLYEAIQCNPNGDPDQENRPRMDYDTSTNLVTDTRIKRYIRDYLKMTGHQIFVDMEGENKVRPERKLEYIIKRVVEKGEQLNHYFAEKPEMLEKLEKVIKSEKDADKVWKKIISKEYKDKEMNVYLLAQIIKEDLIDIRMFGSAFAVEGFNKAYTGPIQLNWGYSLHRVELMDSNSIVTIMNDDSSTFGKDYRVHYSLLAFNGTINKFAAQSTMLTEEDSQVFREAIWKAIPALPTRSKLNQYPKLYLEIVYNEGYHNGHFGDLRQYVKLMPKVDEESKIRSFNDFDLDVSRLKKLIEENRGEGKVIKEVKLTQANGVELGIS